MKRRIFSVLTSAIAASTIIPSAVKQNTESAWQMIQTLGNDCARSVTMSYRSQQLASPDRSTQVYAEGTLRKVRYQQGDTGCHFGTTETLENALVIERQGQVQKFSDQPYDGGYIMYQPRSFSPDGRYLAAMIMYAEAGLGADEIPAVFNLAKGERIQTQGLCQGMINSTFDFYSYVGFSSAVEFVLLCHDVHRNQGESERFEAINLESGTVRQLSDKPSNIRDYGTVLGHFEVTQTQRSQ